MDFCLDEEDDLPELVRGVVVESDQPVVAVAVIAGQLILDKSIYMPVMVKSQM
jgi:hypothetical protein